MKDFRNLAVWKKSHQLALAIYEITGRFPAAEQYGLTSQIRRSGVSIPANIAEGCGKGSNAEFNRFLQMAMGSASELEYHLLLARDLKYLKTNDYQSLYDSVIEIKKMLAGLIKKVRAEL